MAASPDASARCVTQAIPVGVAAAVIVAYGLLKTRKAPKVAVPVALACGGVAASLSAYMCEKSAQHNQQVMREYYMRESARQRGTPHALGAADEARPATPEEVAAAREDVRKLTMYRRSMVEPAGTWEQQLALAVAEEQRRDVGADAHATAGSASQAVAAAAASSRSPTTSPAAAAGAPS